MTNEEFMGRAFELAEATQREKAGPPFGTVIVKDGVIIAEGANRVDAENDPTWHGETSAIRAACKALGTTDLTGCVIYATGEPCPMCAAAIHFARIDKVFFRNPANEEMRWKGYKYGFTSAQAALPTLQRQLPAQQI